MELNMRSKIALLVGLGVGYVLGAKAGRERYEQIKDKAESLWNDPRVQKQVGNVSDFAKEKAPEVVDFVTDNVKKVAGRGKGANGKTGTTTGTATGTTGTTTGTTGTTGTTPGSTGTGASSTPGTSKSK